MNYVFFFPDELRAETLACYGHSSIQTPNFDALAKKGVLFEQCHVQNPVCSPSRCSLFTGQYVHVNGHRTLWNLLKPNEKNLCTYLKDSDYEIRIYGKNDLFSQEAKKNAADDFRLLPPSARIRTEPVIPFQQDGYYNFLYNALQCTEKETLDYQNIQAGMEFIKKRKKGDKPFLLFLPLLMPHCPYTVPEPYYGMYSSADCPPLRPVGKDKPLFHEKIREYRRLHNTDFTKIQTVYMGMVSYTDFLLGEVLECIEESSIADQTVIIASSDHGDYAGDYNLVEKWPNAFEDVITRVPLIIKTPGCTEGHRVAEQVELFDILPTILEFEQIPLRHTQFGKSLIPQLQGNPGDKNRIVYCEGGYNENEPHCNEGYEKPGTAFMNSDKTIYYPKGLQQKELPQTVCRGTMARSPEYKLIIRSSGENELYDLLKDPQELINVYGYPHYKKQQSELETQMLNWYIRTSDAVPFEEDPRN